MIVMKFGGSSLRSAATLEQVASIIRTNIHRRPVIVASAMGDTTDTLLAIAGEARKHNTAAVLKLQDKLKSQHFAASEVLLTGTRRNAIETYFRKTFRDLHVCVLELCERERTF